MSRKLKLAALLTLAAILIAFLLRDVVEQLLVRPVIYLFWLLRVVYQYLPQPILWLALVLVLIYLALGHLAGALDEPSPRPLKHRQVNGPVDELATQIERRQEGIYFKWQIARTLGQIAVDIQELRLHIRSRELDGAGVPEKVYRYLDAGLNTSFADYPLSNSLHWPEKLQLPVSSKSKPGPDALPAGVTSTPFDGELGPVIDFLESKMERDDGLKRA